MPWLGVIGAWVGAGAATSLSAMVVGGVIVGAAVGALYAAFTGGSILEGMMYGAVGGAAIGVGGYFAYGGAEGLAAAGSSGAGVTGGTSFGASEAAQAGHAGYTAGKAGATSSYFATGGKAATEAGIFAGQGGNIATAAASLGGAFMNGKASDEDRDSALAYKEKELAQQKELAELNSRTSLEAAGMSASTARENALTAAESAAADREENRRQFDNTFTEQKRQYDTNRDDVLDAKERFNASVAQSGNYAAGQSKSISLVETNRQRMELPQPSWTTGKDAPQVEVAATNQPQPQGGLLSGAAA